MALTVVDMMRGLDKAIDDEAAHIERVHGPHWEARAEVVRNLVAVGSAIFAGTVTFLDVATPSTCSVDGWLLIASWLLLSVSISSGLFVLWQSVTLRSFYPKLFNNRPAIRREFEAIDLNAANAADKSVEIVKRVVDGVTNPIGRADSRAQAASRICLASFFCLWHAFWRLLSGVRRSPNIRLALAAKRHAPFRPRNASAAAAAQRERWTFGNHRSQVR